MSVCFLIVALFFLTTFIVYLSWSNNTDYGKVIKQSFKTRAAFAISLGIMTVLSYVISCSYSSAREVILDLSTPGGVVYYECDKTAWPDLGIDLLKTKPVYFEEVKFCSQGCRYGKKEHSGPCDGNRVHYYMIFRKSDLMDVRNNGVSDYDKIIKEAASE